MSVCAALVVAAVVVAAFVADRRAERRTSRMLAALEARSAPEPPEVETRSPFGIVPD